MSLGLGFAAPQAITAATAKGVPPDSLGANSSLAIADFDGDLKPDLATAEIDRFDSLSARYLIRFRLTSGTGESFSVTGLFGVPQIVARDVNGDNAPDLIITTVGQPQPIAVLLNDGRGRFNLANPADFPSTVWDSPLNWMPTPGGQIQDTGILVPPRTSVAESENDSELHIRQQQSEIPFSANQGFPSNRLRSSPLSRAPPALA